MHRTLKDNHHHHLEGSFPLIPPKLLEDEAIFRALLSWIHPGFMDMVTKKDFNASRIRKEELTKIEKATREDGILALEYQVDLAELPKNHCGKALNHQEDASRFGPSCAAVYLKGHTGPKGKYKEIASSYLAENKDPDDKLAVFLTKSIELFDNGLGLSDNDFVSCLYPGTTSRPCLVRWAEHDSVSSTSLNSLFFRQFEKTIQFPVMCVLSGNIDMSLVCESFVASLLQLSTLATLQKSDPRASYLFQADDGSSLTCINAGKTFRFQQGVLDFVKSFRDPRDTRLSTIRLSGKVRSFLEYHEGAILDYGGGDYFVKKYGEVISTLDDLTVDQLHSFVSSTGRAGAVASIAAKENMSLEEASSELGRRCHNGAVASIAEKENMSLEEASSEFGRLGHDGAVASIAKKQNMSLKEASSELGSRGNAGAVASIAAKENMSLKEASSELGRRGNDGAVASIAKKQNISLEEAKAEFSRQGYSKSVANLAKKQNISLEEAKAELCRRRGTGKKAREDELNNRVRDTELACVKCYKNTGVTHTETLPIKGTHTTGIMKGHPRVNQDSGQAYCGNCKKKQRKWADPNKIDTVIERCCVRDNCFNVRHEDKNLCQKHLGYVYR